MIFVVIRTKTAVTFSQKLRYRKRETDHPKPYEKSRGLYTMTKKITYLQGYDHYSHLRDIKITFMLNEAERAALDDLMAVLGEKNISAYIRTQLFKPYYSLTEQQKQQLRDVRAFRENENKYIPQHS